MRKHSGGRWGGIVFEDRGLRFSQYFDTYQPKYTVPHLHIQHRQNLRCCGNEPSWSIKVLNFLIRRMCEVFSAQEWPLACCGITSLPTDWNWRCNARSVILRRAVIYWLSRRESVQNHWSELGNKSEHCCKRSNKNLHCCEKSACNTAERSCQT